MDLERTFSAAGQTWRRGAADIPPFYTSAQAAAWVKGFDARTSAVVSRRGDLDTHAALPPYRRRGMRLAWEEGWFAAKSQEVTRV